ncbi:MAG TPA: DNA polymerase III subunit delta' [Deltaproteobacteria bacterium]|nr:DNA polymerase III subunit delta' [Deltaproteobacteria bacterium]
MASLFDVIKGHDREMGLLRRAVAGGRVASAYLFSGPEGVGKRLAALAFAQALNCPHAMDGGPCGRCPSCDAFDGGTPVNLVETAPEKGVLKIDRVRAVAEGLKYRAEAGRTVAIVDGAEKMTAEAANAFLKTLEEPPAGSVIVLVAAHGAHMLPTVLSRCQRVNFGPLPVEVLAGVVREIKEVGEEEAVELARLGCGSVARALEFADARLHEKRKAVIDAVSELDGRRWPELLSLAERLAKDESLEAALEMLKGWYRDGVLAAEGFAAEGLAPHSGGLAPPRGPTARLLDAYDAVEEALRAVRPPRYGNRQLAVETMLMRLAGR